MRTTCAGLLLSACAASPDEPPAPQVVGQGAPLIAGFPANDAAVDAIGVMSLRWEDPNNGDEVFDLVCSGGLIDDNTVVTAKHCIEGVEFAYEYGYEVVFGFGPDASSPFRWVRVITMEPAPGDTGGFTGYGHDVAVLQLEDAILDIIPLKLADVALPAIGEELVGCGYGVRDNSGAVGIRRIGSLTVQARAGRTLEWIFGSFDAYYEWTVGQAIPEECRQEPDGGSVDPSVDCWLLDDLREQYDNTRLEERDEVYVGAGSADAQPCRGDSGSPLLGVDGSGGLVAYGVASGGVSSSRLTCDRGAVYAGFSPAVLAFLDDAKQWVDPCGGLPATGACEGSVAQRCSSMAEGPRRLVEFDCATVGLTCETQADGGVGCGTGDDSFAAPEPSSENAGPAPAELLWSVRSRGIYEPR